MTTSFDYNYQNAFRCNLCFVDFVERFFKNETILNTFSLPQSALHHTQNHWKFPGQKSMFGEILLSGAFVVCTFDVPLYYWGQHFPRITFLNWSSVKVPINQFCSCSFCSCSQICIISCSHSVPNNWILTCFKILKKYKTNFNTMFTV